MKKFLSILLSICMLFALYIPFSTASAENAEIHTCNSDSVSVDSLVPATAVKNIGVFVPVEIEPTSLNENNDINNAKAPPITRVYGEYLRVYPIYEQNEEYHYLKECYAQFKGSMSASYIRPRITIEVQEELKQTMINKGYTPVGWYIEGSIYMNVKQAKYFEYKITDHMGTGSLRRQAAFLGSNVLSCITLYPENPSELYEYGITGTAYYVAYNSQNTSTTSIGVGARFEGTV